MFAQAVRFAMVGVVLIAAITLSSMGRGSALAANNSIRVQATSKDPRDISGVWWIEQYSADLKPPLNAAGRQLHEELLRGIADGSAVDPVRRYCLPQGVVGSMASPYPFEILQTPGMMAMLLESHHTPRLIHMDAAHPPEGDYAPSYGGHSVGRWEGDTLVIDTVYFNGVVTLDAVGHPTSDKLHVVERIRKLDGGKRLENVVTVEDSDYYREPFTIRLTYAWRPDVNIEEWACGEPHRDIAGVPAGTSGRGTQRSAAPKSMADPHLSRRSDVQHPLSGTWNIPGDFRAGSSLDRDRGLLKSSHKGWEERDSILRPWALEMAKQVMVDTAKGEPWASSTGNCYLDGLPAINDQLAPFQIIVTPAEVAFVSQLNLQVRHIHMNQDHPPQVRHTWFGHSVGRWDGDTLVIDTIGLTDRSSLNWDGIPHTSALHVVERWRVLENKRLEVQMTLDDPGAFVKPWNVRKAFQRFGELVEYVCAEDSERTAPPYEQD